MTSSERERRRLARLSKGLQIELALSLSNLPTAPLTSLTNRRIGVLLLHFPRLFITCKQPKGFCQ
jgi:hypothetical protein